MKKDRGEGKRGSTLLETVIAFFVIAGAAAVVTGLFASTTSTQTTDMRSTVMTSLADSRLAEIRAAASGYDGFKDLEADFNGSLNPADFPDYRVDTAVAPIFRPYPCTSIDCPIDYDGSYKLAEVTVTAPRGEQFALTTMVGEPRREVSTLTVSQESGGALLPQGSNAMYKAELFDGSGLIDDIQFSFYVEFGTGYGNLVEQPDGFRASFTNGVPTAGGATIYTGGRARIVARAFYAGQEYRGISDPLGLAP